MVTSTHNIHNWPTSLWKPPHSGSPFSWKDWQDQWIAMFLFPPMATHSILTLYLQLHDKLGCVFHHKLNLNNKATGNRMDLFLLFLTCAEASLCKTFSHPGVYLTGCQCLIQSLIRLGIRADSIWKLVPNFKSVPSYPLQLINSFHRSQHFFLTVQIVSTLLETSVFFVHCLFRNQ